MCIYILCSYLKNIKVLVKKFQELYDFVFSHPESPEEFEMTTNFPKRVVPRGAINLFEVGLKDRDVLFVNDVNA